MRALSTLAAGCVLVAMQACGSSEDGATPPPPGGNGSTDPGTDPSKSDGGGNDGGGPGTDGAAPPPPTEKTSLVRLAEQTAVRPYGVSMLGTTGDLLVIGPDNFQAAGGDRHALALRTDLDGNVKWAKQLAGAFNDQFLAHAIVGTTLHALGITRTVFTGATRNTDVLWVQLDSANGSVLGSRHLGTNTDEDLLGVTAVADGLVIVGTTAANTDAIIAKLGTNNTVTWAKRWATPGDDTFRSIHAVTGGLIAVGFSTISNGGKNQPIVAKFDDAGNHQWSRRISGVPDDATSFSSRVVSDGIVLAGDMKASAAAPTAPFAVKVSLDGTSITWAKSYATNGAGSWRSTVLVATDATYALPETLAVAGYSGSDVAVARISTKDGSVVRSAGVKAPNGATLAVDREVLWERADKGFGLLFHATPSASAISSLGMALPNRLLELPEGCAWSSAAGLTESVVAALTSEALAPTIANLTLTVADNGANLPVGNVPFTKTATCN